MAQRREEIADSLSLLDGDTEGIGQLVASASSQQHGLSGLELLDLSREAGERVV